MTGNQLLVCVSASDTSGDLVRRGMEIAGTFGVDWIAAHVQTPSHDAASDANRSRVAAHLRLAEQLGARVEVLTGQDVAATVVKYAVKNGVTRIVIGKRASRGLRWIPKRSVATRLVKRSGVIDVYVIQGEPRPSRSYASSRRARDVLTLPAISVAAVGAATAVCVLFNRGTAATANIVMIYLLAAFSVSVLSGWIAGLITSVLAVAAFNFFFTKPYYTLNVYDLQYLVTFAVMIVVTLVSSSLAARLKLHAELSIERERRTNRLYELSRKLSEAGGEEQVCEVARQELTGLLDCAVTVATSPRNDAMIEPGGRAAPEPSIAKRTLAGGETDNLSEAGDLFLPLRGHGAVVGVISAAPSPAARRILIDDPSLFAGITSLIALAIEREQASLSARDRLLEVENEKMRNAVLRAVSHDLRTPLAAISGSAATLLHGQLDEASARNLIEAIAEESEWMSRAVENMLNATRFEAGGLQLAVNLEPIDDLVTTAVEHVSRIPVRNSRGGVDPVIRVTLPDELLVVPMDLPLMEQVLINLLDNALRYSPQGSPVSVSACSAGGRVDIVVEDEGPGIRECDRARIFGKFYRGEGSGSTRGAGLGLWICETIVAAHRGTIAVENRESGGARFRISLPVASNP